MGVAFQAELDEGGKNLASVAIGLGGVAPTPIRATEAERILANCTYEEALEKLPEAARKAVEGTKPISDVRASASYRRNIVRVFVQRAAEKVLAKLVDPKGMQK